MVETLTFDETEAIPNEEKFPANEEVLDALEHGDLVWIGRIEDVYPELVGKHDNVVELVETSSIGVSLYEVETSSGKKIRAIFKPQDGESRAIHDAYGRDMYPNEKYAFEIDRHFDFNLVPPTTTRIIDNRIGSLQIFLPPQNFQTGEKFLMNRSEHELDRLGSSEDLMLLQILDNILLVNPDRHSDNYMVRIDLTSNQLDHEAKVSLAAIDNGLSLDTDQFTRDAKIDYVYGPWWSLTYDNTLRKPVEIPIPEKILQKIENGFRHKEELTTFLLAQDPPVPEEEIRKMWQRVEVLLERKIFLSYKNAPEIYEESPRG